MALPSCHETEKCQTHPPAQSPNQFSSAKSATRPAISSGGGTNEPSVTTFQIYDIRLKSYRTALEEFQPSWDGIVRRARGQATAAEYVARDLDDLNGRYEELVDVLQRRLQHLYDLIQQDLDEFEVMS